jgi:hypothetical protein
MAIQPPAMRASASWRLSAAILLASALSTSTARGSTFRALRSTILFPPPKEDVAYRALLGFPWVQSPNIYLPPPPGEAGRLDDALDKGAERSCFAHRALSTLEYFENDDGYDHKWDDVTLYEPHPVRAWRGWHFELASRNPTWCGDIANAVKITVSERACELLESASEDIPCAWPEVGAEDIFFSFSQMGHDKVIDHGPPFRGVWLNRLRDRIVETVTESDEDVLSLGPGLAYRLDRSVHGQGPQHRRVARDEEAERVQSGVLKT